MKELEIVREKIQNKYRVVKTDEDLEWNRAIDLCTNIINAHIKHMNDGWVPVEERLPEDDKYILLSFSNFSLPIVGRYERDEDGSGAFYLEYCDEQDTCIANDLYVNAWQPIPEPYEPKEGIQ